MACQFGKERHEVVITNEDTVFSMSYYMVGFLFSCQAMCLQ